MSYEIKEKPTRERTIIKRKFSDRKPLLTRFRRQALEPSFGESADEIEGEVLMSKATKLQGEALKQAVNSEWMKFVSKPLCWRCGGLMIIEECLYLMRNSGYIDLLTQRCLQCGELVDPIIFWNRRQRWGQQKR